MTPERLKEVLRYDEATGVFTWLVSYSHARVGEEAGRVHEETGYARISIDKKKYKAHRLAWLYVYGSWPKYEIDHINGKRSDNRISNLRDVPRMLNLQNQRALGSQNKSGYFGVSWFARDGRWRAQIRAAGKQRNLGCFDTAEEAHAAYLAAKRMMHEGCTV